METKQIVYYSDGELREDILKLCQSHILKSGVPIISVTLKPMDFGQNIYLPLKRGYLTMSKQILEGLKAATADIIFFCEHDVIYPKSHFDFVPERNDVYYYNTNVWKVRFEDGHALYVDNLRQLSALSARRELLLRHYENRVRLLQEETSKVGEENINSFVRKMGFEPGTHNRNERVDDYKYSDYKSAVPLVDIRHDANLTPNRWVKEKFRNQIFTQGWTESEDIPGWGKFKDILKG